MRDERNDGWKECVVSCGERNVREGNKEERCVTEEKEEEEEARCSRIEDVKEVCEVNEGRKDGGSAR